MRRARKATRAGCLGRVAPSLQDAPLFRSEGERGAARAIEREHITTNPGEKEERPWAVGQFSFASIDSWSLVHLNYNLQSGDESLALCRCDFLSNRSSLLEQVVNALGRLVCMPGLAGSP